jgi:hypothetical protein
LESVVKWPNGLGLGICMKNASSTTLIALSSHFVDLLVVEATKFSMVNTLNIMWISPMKNMVYQMIRNR